MKTFKTLTMAIMILAVTSLAFATEGHNHSDHKQKGTIQEICPVMGGKIDKKYYVDVKGKRIYVCCPGCIGEIKANPDKYIKKLTEKGIKLETVRK